MSNADDREIELLRYGPPDENELSALRETRVKDKQMKNKFVKLGDYLFVLIVLVLVSYGNRDPTSFLMRKSLEQEFIHPLTASYPKGIVYVNNWPLFLQWAENTFVPHLYEQDWYNGDKVNNRTGFTSGRQSIRVGKIRLRQVRVRKGSCTVPKLVTKIAHECNPPFDESHEETRMYSPRWKDGREEKDSHVRKRSASGYLSPWVYLNPSESNSSLTFNGRIAFYPGGGYVAELGDTVEDTAAFTAYLKTNHWIDRYTRAVFIEGALYNPNTNLIGVLETVFEVTSTNGLLPRTNVNIFRLFAKINPSYVLYSACEFLFFGIVLYTLYTIIKGIYLRKKDYFREAISWIDMVFFVNGLAIVVVYILRESLLRRAVEVLKKDQESFLNFSECGMMSEELVFLYAFASFIAILRLINFLSFTRIVQLLSTTIYRSVVELKSLSVMLFTIFTAYASLAYLIYGPYLEDYRSFSATLASLISLMMGVFDFRNFTSQTDYKTVGYFFFSTFTSSMIFIFTNMIITIINAVHRNVYKDQDLQQNEDTFLNIILHRLLTFAGFRGPPQREEPVIEEPSIAELQWNLNVQYLMENQLKRLNGLVNSIYFHDEIEDIILSNHLSKRQENERKPEHFITEDNTHENAPDQTTDCDHWGRVDAEMNSNQRPISVNTHLQTNPKMATEELRKPTDTIFQLIAKKTEELRLLQEDVNCDERERLRRVKVIKCLQDFLEKMPSSNHDLEILSVNRPESDV